MTSKLFWHFVNVDAYGTPRLRYGDGREIVVGKTLRFDGSPVLCHAGMHASERLWDALGYARGDSLSLCRVTLSGTVVHDSDKSVATERTVISMLDAGATEKLLRDFARWCALQVIHLWSAPDIVRQYLETGDESLRAAAWYAAGAAAWDAAWDAAGAAARYAAGAAARAAARYAAGAAAWDAAGAAAWYAAGAAAWDAAIEHYAGELERRAIKAIKALETKKEKES